MGWLFVYSVQALQYKFIHVALRRSWKESIEEIFILSNLFLLAYIEMEKGFTYKNIDFYTHFKYVIGKYPAVPVPIVIMWSSKVVSISGFYAVPFGGGGRPPSKKITLFFFQHGQLLFLRLHAGVLAQWPILHSPSQWEIPQETLHRIQL